MLMMRAGLRGCRGVTDNKNDCRFLIMSNPTGSSKHFLRMQEEGNWENDRIREVP